MRSTVFLRIALCASCAIGTIAKAQAQGRATCLYTEMFAPGGLPTDWYAEPAEVERLDGDGNGTGAFTAPWTVGASADANAAGYFPVPDMPLGNTFAMANDDAPPCDCAMADVSLVSRLYDLTTLGAPAVSYRVFHDGLPGSGDAWLEASANGVDWSIVEVVPTATGTWQQRVADLGAFAGGTMRLRFRYDDGGTWASGLAIDDVCVFDRPQDDIAFVGVWTGDATLSAFNTAVRSLGYSRMPMEQQSPLFLSARIRNNGVATATAIRVEATIIVDGGTPVVLTTTVLDTLAPLSDTLVSWDTGFLAGEPGHVGISLALEGFAPDDEPSDNAAELAYIVTSSDEGGHAMGIDNDLGSTVCGYEGGFSAGCRFELLANGSTVQGISVRFGVGTEPGSRVNALLTDANFDLLSSSASHLITEEELTLSFSGGSVFIPLDSAVAIDAAQDVIALVRCLPDSGALRVSCGGPVGQGAAFLVAADDLQVTYPHAAPIVRIHLSTPVTALLDVMSSRDGLTITPNPTAGPVTVAGFGPIGGTSLLEVFDTRGRRMRSTVLSAGATSVQLETTTWPAGVYTVHVTADDRVFSDLIMVR